MPTSAMDKTRYYEIRSAMGPNGKCVRWGLSRFGLRHDEGMSQAIGSIKVPGDGTSFCVGFTPSLPKLHSPARVGAQRVRNMKARAAKLPLFASQIEAEELKREYYSLAQAERDQAERRAYIESWASRFWDEHPESLRLILPAASIIKAPDDGTK